MIVCLIAVAAAVGGGIAIWNGTRQKTAKLEHITAITVTTQETYPAGEKLGEVKVTAEGVDEDGNHVVRELSAEEYVITPEQVPEHGHEFEINATLAEDEEIRAEATALIGREEVQRYEIGRQDPEAIQAVLYENGDLEIAGNGAVKNFKEHEIPWQEDGVLYLTWIDPAAEIERMDDWFSGNTDFVAMLCPVPDTVRSMVRTFYGCTSMETVPDMRTAVYLEDLTACYSGSAVRDGGELPGNLRTAEEAYRDCKALVHAADASACVQLASMKNCYNGCTALSDTSTPDSVTNLQGAYQNCLNITRVSIPSKAENLASAYSGCTGLTVVEGEIPASCTSMSGAFKDCKFLEGELTIHCTTQSLSGVFSGAAKNSHGLTVSLSWEGKTTDYQTEEEILGSLAESIEKQAKVDDSNITVKKIEQN
ncbi:MAG: leucine-rich repeat protein [Lacrimispora saccharolytica]